MAIAILDNRSVIDDADAVTGWSANDAADTSVYAEAPASVSLQVNISTDELWFTAGSPIDLTTAGNELVYIWSFCLATQNSWKDSTLADSSHMMLIGDGTNQLALCEAGNDRDVFKHADDPFNK